MAKILARRRHRAEGGGRAEVHSDAGRAVQLLRRHRVDDEVGPHGTRVAGEDGHAGLDAGPDHQSFNAELRGGHGSVFAAQPRDHRPQGEPCHGVTREAVEPEQRLEEGGDLISGLPYIGRDTPTADQFFLGEKTHVGLGVSYVDGQQHGHHPSLAELKSPR